MEKGIGLASLNAKFEQLNERLKVPVVNTDFIESTLHIKRKKQEASLKKMKEEFYVQVQSNIDEDVTPSVLGQVILIAISATVR